MTYTEVVKLIAEHLKVEYSDLRSLHRLMVDRGLWVKSVGRKHPLIDAQMVVQFGLAAQLLLIGFKGDKALDHSLNAEIVNDFAIVIVNGVQIKIPVVY